ncbi:MAG TPA: ATP-binding cassette domain-containing protein [Acidobacteriaceae bacterium]|nr:ATP-binding cassette domain-containing protein [Acidobacteriaceae bacterium]
MSSPLLRVQLSAGYGKAQVLSDVCFDLYAGERLGLLGNSGAGKSTLLLALLGLLPHRGGWAKGEVVIGGKNLLALREKEARRLRGRTFALVPQSPLSALNPSLSLHAHFQACWKAHRAWDKPQFQGRVTELMHRVDLPSAPEFLQRKPGQISVGQAQRCTLALALLHRPALLIADEPTSSLDPVTQTEVINLLRGTCEEQGAALLFVSHDLFSVFRLCSDVAMLSGGRLVDRLPLHAVSAAQDPGLRALLHSLPLPADLLLRHLQAGETASQPLVTSETLLTQVW